MPSCAFWLQQAINKVKSVKVESLEGYGKNKMDYMGEKKKKKTLSHAKHSELTTDVFYNSCRSQPWPQVSSLGRWKGQGWNQHPTLLGGIHGNLEWQWVSDGCQPRKELAQITHLLGMGKSRLCFSTRGWVTLGWTLLLRQDHAANLGRSPSAVNSFPCLPDPWEKVTLVRSVTEGPCCHWKSCTQVQIKIYHNHHWEWSYKMH